MRALLAFAVVAIAQAADAASSMYGAAHGNVETNGYLAAHGIPELLAFKLAAVAACAVALAIRRTRFVLSPVVVVVGLVTLVVAAHNVLITTG